MFDVSFSEILLIAVVALIVIGPEKLPKVARMLGLLTGRMQRYVSTVKAEIEREMQLDEVRKLEQETRNIGDTVQSGLMSEARKVDEALGSAVGSVGQAAKSPVDKPAA
jgi:sec-independent protein translocase protein TatB